MVEKGVPLLNANERYKVRKAKCTVIHQIHATIYRKNSAIFLQLTSCQIFQFVIIGNTADNAVHLPLAKDQSEAPFINKILKTNTL